MCQSIADQGRDVPVQGVIDVVFERQLVGAISIGRLVIKRG
jgi:hypothetical protein